MKANDTLLQCLQTNVAEVAGVVGAIIEFDQLAAWESTQRIPKYLHYQTFFSEHNFWVYQSVDDDRRCFACKVLDQIVWNGDELRLAFPYLVIVDADTIFVLVHPNCRCKLRRITNPLDYLLLDLGVDSSWVPGLS